MPDFSTSAMDALKHARDLAGLSMDASDSDRINNAWYAAFSALDERIAAIEAAAERDEDDRASFDPAWDAIRQRQDRERKVA